MIGFRVDSNNKIATGHLMRCITIALQCKKNGEDVIFFMAEENNIEMLEKNNINFEILHSDWQNWDLDIKLMKDKIVKWNISKLVVDSYQVSPLFLKKINSIVKVMYIDDFCNQKLDVTYLSHALYWDNDYYLEKMYSNTDVVMLNGLKYVLLRDEFSKINQKQTRKKQIVITTGGTDTYHVTFKLANEIVKDEIFAGYKLLLILGVLNPDEQIIKELCSEYPNVEYKKNISNMADVFSESEYVILAGGNTIYEACACGTHAISFSFADNQLNSCNEFDKRKIIPYAGDARKFTESISKIILTKLKQLMHDIEYQNNSRNCMQQLVDGKGAQRIASVLCGK